MAEEVLRMPELPAEFCEKMKGLLGDQYPKFEASYGKDRLLGLRLNLLKLGKGEERIRYGRELLEGEGFHLRPIPWAQEGFFYQESDRPGKHPFHEAGLYYIQEPSAMVPAALLEPEPGERILDLCAAPGGKTTQILSALGGAGLLVANEIHPARAQILSQNVERMGGANCVVLNETPLKLAGRFHSFFHRILVDAPCSGEGMFRKDGEAIKQWSPDHVKMCARRQQEILDCVAAMLCPGGRMVYSTCTFSPEENEGTVLEFLKTHPDFYVEKTKKFPGFSEGRPRWAGQDEDSFHLAETVRIFPQDGEGEGHYAAVLRREGNLPEGTEEQAGVRGLKGAQLEEYMEFASSALKGRGLCRFRGEDLLFGERLYRIPKELGALDGLKVLRPGLELGSFKKKRFEPAHALAMALKPEEARLSLSLEPGGEEALRYLRGEALSLDGDQYPWLKGEKGWILVCIGTFSAGWGKLSGNVLKNHYPKGLRIR